MYSPKIKETLNEIKEVTEKIANNLYNEPLVKEYSCKLNLLTKIIDGVVNNN